MFQRRDLTRDLQSLNLREQFAQAEQQVSELDVVRTHPFYSGRAEIPKHYPALFLNCICVGTGFR